jgi:hypothetical protein
MRNLTRGQKKLLKKAVDDYKERNGEYPRDIGDLDSDVLETIDKLNPCEIFWQNVNRFLWDLED